MVNGKDARIQEFAAVTGVFLLVCGGVLAVASSAPPPDEPPPPEVLEMKAHAEETSAALEDHDYERAKASIEAMCTQIELLDRGSQRQNESSPGQEPVTLAE